MNIFFEKNFPMFFEHSQKLILNNESYQYNEIINDNSNLSNIMEEIFKVNAIQESQIDEYSSLMNNNNKKIDEQTTKSLTLKTNNTIPFNQELNKEQELKYKCFTFNEIKDILNNKKFSGLS